MGKTSRKAKTPPGDFKVTASKNPLINNQADTSIRNLTNYPGLSQNTDLVDTAFCTFYDLGPHSPIKLEL